MAKLALKRNISLPVLALYGLGNILGAGIYVLVGKVAGAAGYSAPLAFFIAMLIAAFSAMSYMELSSRFPHSTGSSLYTFKAFGKRLLSLLIGLAMIGAGVTSASLLAQGFSGYFDTIIPSHGLLVSVIVLVILTALTLKGIGASAKTAALFTLVEVAGLLLVIGFGLPHLGAVEPEKLVTIDPAVGWSGLLLGAFLAFYAFIGFEDMVNVAEEVKRPERAMPLAILISLITGTTLYLLVVIVSISAVTPAELAASGAPLSLVLDKISSVNPGVIALIGMAAALNGIIVQLIMASRMLYGMSSQGWLPRLFSTIDAKRHTPIYATLAVAAATFGAVLFPIESLAKVTSFLVLVIFCLINVSLIFIKLRQPKPAAVTVPMAVPIAGSISSFSIVAYQLVELFS